MSDWFKYVANSILNAGDTGLKIQKLKDGSKGRGGERSQETKEDAENEATETEDIGEKEAHKEEKNPRDRLHKSKGRIFNHKYGQFGRNAKMQTATKNTPDLKIYKSQIMEEPAPMGGLQKEELQEENFKEKGYSEEENQIKKENPEDHRKIQEEEGNPSAGAEKNLE